MRSCSLALLLLFLYMQSHAQQGDSLIQALINKRCDTRKISIPSYRIQYPATPAFNNISVLDYRRDTLRIGITTDEPYSQRQLLFGNSTATTLGAYLAKHYTDPNARNQLMVVVKDLWISDFVAPGERSSRYKWKIRLHLEAYLQQERGYIPLTWLDTTETVHGQSFELAPEHYLPRLIAAFMDKVDSLALDEIAGSRRSVTFSQIDSFCHSRFHFPIETGSRLTKGVYANLDEFRNNKPSITNYQFVKDKQGIVELQIADENGRYIYNHTAWGLCDGEHAFVMMDGNCFPIFTLNHQFYVLGSKRYSRSDIWVPLYAPLGPAAFMTGLMSVSENVRRDLRIYPMDLETGTLGQ